MYRRHLTEEENRLEEKERDAVTLFLLRYHVSASPGLPALKTTVAVQK